MKKILLLILLISFKTYGQNVVTIDSLKLEIANSKSDTAKIGHLIKMSTVMSASSLTEAMNYSKKAYDLAEKSGTEKHKCLATTELGRILVLSGNYNMALRQYFSALKLTDTTQFTIELLAIYINIGVIFDRIRDFDNALSYYFKALHVSGNLEKKFRGKGQIQTLYNNIGNIYETREENETAIAYYQKATDQAIRENDNKVLGIAYNNLGKIYLKLKQPDKALDYLKKGLEKRQQINDWEGISKSYNFLSAHYFQTGNNALCIEYGLKGFELAKQHNSIPNMQQSMMFLVDAYEKEENYPEAFKALRLFKDLSDSLLNKNTISEITRIQMQFEYEKSEEAHKAREFQLKMFAYVAVSIMILIVAVLFLLFRAQSYRNKKIKLEKEALEKDIEIKNKELTTNVMYLIKKNELLNDVSQKLLMLKKEAGPEHQKQMQNLIFDIQTEASNSVWSEFEQRFQQVHNDFYKKLRDKFPELSPADIKLCALLKLNLSTKEIAALTYQSAKSVEVARARVRKKLNLTNQDINLVTFLMDL